MMDINLEAGHIVEITTAPSTPPKKLSVPILGLEKFPTQQEIEGQDVRNRRPVRPIDRQRMRPWLMELLDLGNVFGLRWTSRNQGIFQISWRHASRLGWNLETDGDVFERWARHTGIYKEGDPPEPKRWKANFRCALHSLHDVMELTNAVERRGRNACRTYQFLQNNTSANPKSRSKEKRQKPIEPKEPRELVHVLTYERPIRQPVQIQLQPESGSSDELLSETESEGSHQDKVIVQRLDPKTGELGEEFLLHDHDYSGHQEKTQRTIYLRQGVGSIVLHKEVLNAPQLVEDAKAAEALANLEQLASAAVDSQDLEGGTIMIDANVLSEGSNKGSPTKSSGLNEDNSGLNLKTLLPRLRARIKESERAGGLVRKRKFLEADPEMEEKRILGHNQYRLKKARSEAGISPPSPPMTRRRSGSPKKQSKNSAKTKRSRKESEGSASDSTEPLMSSCLLLLEAATRLDNAEKREVLSDKSLSRHSRKGGESTPMRGKKRKGLRSERKVEEMEEDFSELKHEIVEEAVIEEGVEESFEEGGNEETVIEEKIVYPEDCLQIVYEEAVNEEAGHITETEVHGEVEEPAVYDLLRTALENIGSELEVSTSCEISSPKEMAIMRRKKDSEKAPVYNALSVSGGKIVVSESSFAKGLFSGSEIVPNISQTASNVKKATKVKSSKAAISNNSKDNIYYVDVRSNGGSICVRQSDGIEIPVLNPSPVQKQVIQGPTSTSVLQGIASTASSPQIYIAAGQNSSGQPIVLPMNNQKLMSTISTSSLQQADLTSLKQAFGNINSGKSFISLGPQGKPIILKSNPKEASTSSSVPVVNQVGSQVLPSSVKISTLPIISTLKPIVSIPAPTTSVQRKPVSPTATSSSVFPVHLVRNVSSTNQTPVNTSEQQTVNLVSSQIGSVSQGSKTFLLQAQNPSNLDPNKNQSSPLKFHLVTTGDSLVATVPATSALSQTQAPLQTQVITSPVLSTTTSAVIAGQKNSENVTSGSINAQVIIDPIKGPYLKLPVSSAFPLSQNLVLSSTPNTTTTQPPLQTFLVHPPGMEIQCVNEAMTDADNPGNDAQQLNLENQATAESNIQMSDFEQVEIYSSTNNAAQTFVNNSCVKLKGTNDNSAESVVKMEQDYADDSSTTTTTTLTQNEGGEGLVFTVKQEEPYYVPVQGQVSQSDAAPSPADIRVEVQSEMGNQTCFISPEQLEQANHIIHISQEEIEEEGPSKMGTVHVEKASVESGEAEEQIPVVLDKDSVVVKAEEEGEYSDSAAEPSSHSMSIDPRAPLAIREIPLFATSKSDSESTEDHNVE